MKLVWVSVRNIVCIAFVLLYLNGFYYDFQPTKELIEEHYSEHIHEHFYGKLVEHMISGPIIPMVWEGPDAVRLSHRMLGKSDPRDGIPGTIRGDFSIDRERSVVHGSHSIEAADREISMWFRRHEFTESHHAIHC